jgi:hypothetical protein
VRRQDHVSPSPQQKAMAELLGTNIANNPRTSSKISDNVRI